ncbi:PKD domain-containing protein, partial [Candidatus Bipolaricaulota bacterium]|nr:PKD domain-containing protein [Candidatus Bipolaricaulota bacterium]
VTDNRGATATTTQQVVVSAQANRPPNASFTISPSTGPIGTTFTFNAGASRDPDGWIVSFAWQFGDGTTGAGMIAHHAYRAAGTQTVRLTVTDNRGATASAVRQVTITRRHQPTAALSIALSLPKTVYQVGEPIVIGYRTNREAYVYIYAVDAAGVVTLLFPSHFQPNNRVPAGTHSLPGAGYRLRVSDPLGTVTLYAFAATRPIPNFPTRFGGGFPILSRNPAAFRNAVLQAIQTQLPAGSWAKDTLSFTVVSAAPQTGILWATSSPQGATVSIDGAFVGTTPIQVSVAAGMRTVIFSLTGHHNVTRQVNVPAGRTTQLHVPLTAVARNQPPTAVLTIRPSVVLVGQAVTFDGSGSTDPDGWIVSYRWDFGDGASAAGVRASRIYAAAGTYHVRLTVTDNQGATHTAIRTLSVGFVAPPVPRPPWGPQPPLPRPPWGGATGEPPMGGTAGIFVWGTDTWHVTVNAGAGWTNARRYRLELRTDGAFQNVNRTTSAAQGAAPGVVPLGLVPLGLVPTPTDGGRTLIFEGSLVSGRIDHTFTVPDSESVWMRLQLDIDGDGDLDESTGFVHLRSRMVRPPTVPFVVGLQKGDSGPLVPGMNFRIGSAFIYTATTRFVMWATNIVILEAR